MTRVGISVRQFSASRRDTSSTNHVDTGDATRHAAFRRYVEPELEVLLRVARRLTVSTGDAEDVVQDTLVRAYRALDRFDGRHPRAWLLTILRNTWKNSLRRRRPVLVDDPDRAFERTPARGADGRSGAEEYVMVGTVDGAIVSALRSLTKKKRDVVLLVDVDGLTYQEAADVLEIPVGTVMSRLHRARTEMRTRLQDSGYVRGGG